VSHLLFFDDTPSFGGHEVMTFEYLRGICRQGTHEITVMYYEGNAHIEEKIGAMVSDGLPVRSAGMPFCYTPARSLFPVLAASDILRIARAIRSLSPDVLIAVQGNIEISSAGVVAAKLAGTKVVSYLPLAQSMRSMGLRHGRIRDFFDRLYYNLPDRYVTISKRQKDLLVKRGIGGENVDIVHNCIDMAGLSRIGKGEARSRLGLEGTPYHFGTVGRIAVKHKGQDFLLHAIAQAREILEGVRFVFVGEGPDQGQVEALINRYRLQDVVTLLPWQADPSTVYSALDAVVIPSFFEGVPLVMLEAVYYGIPVVGSSIDGIAEFLPAAWRFAPGSVPELVDRLRFVMGNDQSDLVLETNREFRGLFFRENPHREFLHSVLRNSVRR